MMQQLLSSVIVNDVMPRVAFYDCYAGCHLGECRYADCRGARLTSLTKGLYNKTLYSVGQFHLLAQIFKGKYRTSIGLV